MKYGKFICLLLVVFSFTADAQCVGEQNAKMAQTTPIDNFVIQDGGVAVHKSTGLMWQRCSLGQTWNGSTCIGEAEIYGWHEALDETREVSFAGYVDWRLPNKNELASILEYSCFDPAINVLVFPETPSDWYWTSTPKKDSQSMWSLDHAWSVNFDDGQINGSQMNGKKRRVRLVRIAD